MIWHTIKYEHIHKRDIGTRASVDCWHAIETWWILFIPIIRYRRIV